MINFRALCAELVGLLDDIHSLVWGEAPRLLDEDRGGDSRLDIDIEETIEKVRAALAQPEPEGPTDEQIMELMPQQMHEDLAAAARALAEQAGTDSRSATGVMRIMLNRHTVDLARAVLARWGRPAVEPVPVSERLPGPADCDEEGRCFVWDHVSAEWRFLERDIFDYGWPESYWLPHHVLPVPQQEGSK